MNYTTVTITGPAAKLSNLVKELSAAEGAVPIEGNGPDNAVVLRLVEDDYGDGPDAPLLAEVGSGVE